RVVIAGAPYAAWLAREGATTLGHVAAQALPVLPNLAALGLGHAARAASGHLPKGFYVDTALRGQWGYGVEVSNGKDTPSGHWEIAGVPVTFDWGYFPKTIPCFPRGLTDAI